MSSRNVRRLKSWLLGWHTAEDVLIDPGDIGKIDADFWRGYNFGIHYPPSVCAFIATCAFVVCSVVVMLFVQIGG